MAKNLDISVKAVRLLLLLLLVFPLKGAAQSGDAAVEELIKLGFEDVSCTETDNERVYVMQNTAYRLQGKGMSIAVDVIQEKGMPEGRDCRIVVLKNNIPQYSLLYRHAEDADGEVGRADWEATYELGDSWKIASKTKKKNRSLYKVDILVYPKFLYRNLIINKPFTFNITLSPAFEVSLWKGNKVTGQVMIPIKNEYGTSMGQDEIRQGYITLSQDWRWKNLFLAGTIGTFNNNRWGGHLAARYAFKDPRFMVDGEIAYTGVSYFSNWRWQVSPLKRLTWSIGGSFYWPRYNVKFDLHLMQYLLHERGVEFQMVRSFRHVAVGLYARKVFKYGGNHGLNGGVKIAINLPPFKYKRTGYVPRIMPSLNTTTTYNAGNELYYGRSFLPRVDENFGTESSFNPIFIKSELLNF